MKQGEAGSMATGGSEAELGDRKGRNNKHHDDEVIGSAIGSTEKCALCLELAG